MNFLIIIGIFLSLPVETVGSEFMQCFHTCYQPHIKNCQAEDPNCSLFNCPCIKKKMAHCATQCNKIYPLMVPTPAAIKTIHPTPSPEVHPIVLLCLEKCHEGRLHKAESDREVCIRALRRDDCAKHCRVKADDRDAASGDCIASCLALGHNRCNSIFELDKKLCLYYQCPEDCKLKAPLLNSPQLTVVTSVQ
jgi:hypothetical protein